MPKISILSWTDGRVAIYVDDKLYTACEEYEAAGAIVQLTGGEEVENWDSYPEGDVPDHWNGVAMDSRAALPGA